LRWESDGVHLLLEWGFVGSRECGSVLLGLLNCAGFLESFFFFSFLFFPPFPSPPHLEVEEDKAGRVRVCELLQGSWWLVGAGGNGGCGLAPLFWVGG